MAELVRHHEPVMGTVVSFLIDPGLLPAPEVHAAMEESCAELHRLDGIFSTWVAESPMSRYRRGDLDWCDLPEEIPVVLELCATAKEISGGWFDPWAMPGGVDPTGLVKGWAVERATAVLARAGVAGALVNGGGDVATYGSSDGQASWRIGVQHPWRADAVACIVEIAGGHAVATSGRYQRGEHLIDPFAAGLRHREAGARAASATVSGPSLAVADALATAIMVADSDALGTVEALRGYSAYRILEDGTEEATTDFPLAGTRQPCRSAR
jgi:thiamine biosynthesis lipoprotein